MSSSGTSTSQQNAVTPVSDYGVDVSVVLLVFTDSLLTCNDDEQGLVSSNDVVIFSKTWCPYSKKAKELIKTLHPDDKVKIIEYVIHCWFLRLGRFRSRF
jgi:hypothetical protein